MIVPQLMEPQEGYNMLHMVLTDKELDQLSKLYQRYQDVGNQGLSEESKEDGKQVWLIIPVYMIEVINYF
jgi:hypothetical protein